MGSFRGFKGNSLLSFGGVAPEGVEKDRIGLQQIQIKFRN